MCYAMPIAAALTTSFVWNKTKNVKIWWLNLMFYGGALFGTIDHLWNGELFFISRDIVSDLLLGVVITLCIFFAWTIILIKVKDKNILARQLKR